MKLHSSALITVVVAGVLLAGCTNTETSSRGLARAGSVTGSAADPDPAPSAIPAEDELRGALGKTQKATYKFSVQAQAPDKERMKGNGSVDPKARRIATTVKITGGKYPSSRRRIVIRNDLYDRDEIAGGWAHLDMKRLKKYTHLRVDMADPVGLGTFTSAIESVRRTGPRSYAGTFSTTPKDGDEFLPIGAPTLVVFGGTADFTATTDAKGWVTKISVTLKVKETLTMTTTFSGHGKPLSITKPKNVGEVDDFYYE